MESIGTNAAGLCLALNRPVQVFAAEHYNINLHNLNCSATPIHAPGGVLVGALNILSYATPQNRQTLGFTTSIAKAIENQLALTRTVTSLKVSNAQLNTMMGYLPQGVISLDRSGRVESCNVKFLEMFSIPSKTNRRVRFALIEDILDGLPGKISGCRRPDRVRTLEIKGRKKSFLVNTHTIEDAGRIMSLSAVQSNRASYTFDDIIGQCPGLLKAKKQAAMVAPTDSGVLLVGESGTGKELFAHAIHAASLRCNMPFVAINCGAIPADII